MKRNRIYDSIVREHLATHRKMAFLSGPRQVGKTTAARQAGTAYLDWDNQAHRRIILQGPPAVAEYSGLTELTEKQQVVVFDELHKYSRWKSFLKGFYDVYEEECRIIVTGSSRLDVYKRGGDSLMGRYFGFRMHPFSVAELLHTEVPRKPIRKPAKLGPKEWKTLWEHGGFPEPFLKADARFTRRWSASRRSQLFKEDLRDLTRVQELNLLDVMGQLLADRSGEQLVIASLAQDIQAAPNTAKGWVEILCSLHYGFLVRPWFRNVAKGLRKEPKWFLRDWAAITNPGQRAETFLACHLLKAVEAWTDLGLGVLELRYVRDKQKREVDFVVIRDNEPWFLVEAKKGERPLSPNLDYFQKQLGATHAFQVALDKEYVDADCFKKRKPTIVPARTFLSQLV